MVNFQKEQLEFNPQQVEQIYNQTQERLKDKKDIVEKKEVIKEAIDEKIQQSISVGAKTSSSQSQNDDKNISLKLSEIKNLPEEKKVDALVRIALKDSINDSVKIAQKLGPYYIDALHDTLVDEFLNILIQQKKI